MQINFFEASCKTTTNASVFGLCDKGDKSPAYIDEDFAHTVTKWIAIVINSFSPQVIDFIAIDNCIEIRRENGDMDNRCDGMLCYPENIVFVELKDKRRNWLKEGMQQIETTLQHFKANHELSAFKHKRAFIANKQHPQVPISINAIKKEFSDKYGVLLKITTQIPIE